MSTRLCYKDLVHYTVAQLAIAKFAMKRLLTTVKYHLKVNRRVEPHDTGRVPGLQIRERQIIN